MDLFKQGMKGPTRPAPSVPGLGVNRYSPVTNWNDDPFGTDVFEPTPSFAQKKKPPPRPPPPKVVLKQPDVPAKPSHFIRKPTVLSSLLSRKNKAAGNQNQNPNVNMNTQSLFINNELDPHKLFPKCESKNVQTAALIDLSSPPSSPTFTTRSSSDGLSVDSFGSDATTSTSHQNPLNGGNASQTESGFEDDFDLFLTTRKPLPKEDTFEDLVSVDPFSPQTQSISKPPVMKKPVLSKDLFDVTYNMNGQSTVPALKGPTIIRAKPARPKPPDNSALLKNTFGSNFPVTSMNVNTSIPIQKVFNGVGDNSETKASLWEEDCEVEGGNVLLEREWSPPMPSVPPPPPPAADEEPSPTQWLADDQPELEEPYAIALFDYFTDHPDDLCFSTGAKISLVRQVDNEWLMGRVRSGAEGLFPANYVDVRVPLPQQAPPPAARALSTATAIFHFKPDQPGDLPFRLGDTINVLYKLSDEWYFGECNGVKGQFPANYVQMS